MDDVTELATRHPSTQAAMKRLSVNPNLGDAQRELATLFLILGSQLVSMLPDDPDLSDALRKLWEAKNCAVYLSDRVSAKQRT